MDLGTLIGFLGMVLTCAIVGGAFVGAWAMGRMRGQQEAEEDRLRAAESEARLVRVERLVEAMSLDLERMAEAQRFAARTLAAQDRREVRPEALPPARP
jgi:hypothetical protein